MAKSLVIVESPAKARTLKKYLGADFSIKASVGHIVDLPATRLGVDVDNDFIPEYEVIKDKKKVIDEIRKAAVKADVVFLAPDPDREGEAIAYHLAQQIGDKTPVKRVLFNEITAKAVKEAIANPTELDTNKFEAQQARRILDRLVGYKISPILWKKVKRGLSAGRVQSVAVRLIVDREKEIQAFDKEEYWSITAVLGSGEPPAFEAELAQLDGKKIALGNQEQADAAKKQVESGEWVVDKVTRKSQKSKAQAPFVTARLLRDASSRLGFNAKRTMSIAQRLYEGIALGADGEVGLITYMRTDSTRIAGDALGAVRSHIKNKFGSDYLPEKPNFFSNRNKAQDAHEAIRPTAMNRPPAAVAPFLKKEELQLYSLIWNRFVASQMTPAVFDQTAVEIVAGPGMFKASGSTLKFPGHLAAYEEGKRVDKLLPPDLKKGLKLKLEKLTPNQHFTQPPPRYTEAGLIRVLEEKGIGRPSTYAAIMTTIQGKDYVRKEKNAFIPTELGMMITELLIESFPDIMDIRFTAGMEDQLDEVESGKVESLKVLKKFYKPFAQRLSEADQTMRNVKRESIPTDFKCDKCGEQMMLRWGRNGRFLACSGYPDCGGTKNVKVNDEGKIEIVEDVPFGEPCEKCGSTMVIKKSRFGRFVACTGYPNCRNTRSIPTGVSCPKKGCEGDLVERTGKRGKLFFGCSAFPKCDFISWDRPVKEPCPQCDSTFLVEKSDKRSGRRHQCPNKECGYRKAIEENEAEA